MNWEVRRVPDKEYYETLAYEYVHCPDLRHGLELAIRLRKLSRLISESYDEKPIKTPDGRVISGMTQQEMIDHVAWMKRWEYWHGQVRSIQKVLGFPQSGI
jgi:hypothetical protein